MSRKELREICKLEYDLDEEGFDRRMVIEKWPRKGVIHAKGFVACFGDLIVRMREDDE